jgi:DNA-binding response OmpR family regulator
MNTSPNIEELFAAQQAEIEQSWLSQVFVAPYQGADIVNARSTAIIGGSGSGKTALRLMLLEKPADDRLVVSWLPKLLINSDQPATDTIVYDLLQAIACELIRSLGCETNRFDTASEWVQEELAVIIATLFDKHPATKRIAGRLSAGLSARGQQIISQLLLPAQTPELYGDARPQYLIEALTSILPELGYRRAWVIIDGLERLEAYIEQGRRAVAVLCAMLALFELPELTFKLLVPDSFATVIQQSRSFERRRLDLVELHWSELELMHMLERRLGLLLGRPALPLDELASANLLLRQLRSREATPRTWIETLRPFVEQFYAQGAFTPLSRGTVTRLSRFPTPILRLSGDQFFLNGHEITTLQPQSRQILAYLFARRGQVCTREEIYYCVLRALPAVPQRHEPAYEEAGRWRIMIETALSRLRYAIEPNPEQPIFLLTKRGQGIMLALPH